MTKNGGRRTVKELVEEHVTQSVDSVFSEAEITRLRERNISKIHPLSTEARVIGGVIQSANIRFGNQLQNLITSVMEQSTKVKVHELSGLKVPLPTSGAASDAIERYISARESSSNAIKSDYSNLQRKLSSIRSRPKTKVRDVDLLISPKNGKLILVELKFNDDHDTGKRPDIYRKVLHTADGLGAELGRSVKPVVCYFNSEAGAGTVYLPESQIMDGRELFQLFADVSFSSTARAIMSASKIFDRKLRSLTRRM